MAKKKSTPSQKKLSISRNGDQFTFKWVLGSTAYSSQTLRYRYRTRSGSWCKWLSDIKVSKSATSAVWKNPLKKEVYGVDFQLCAIIKSNKKIKYVRSKRVHLPKYFQVPQPPGVVFAVDDSSAAQGTFTITATNTVTSFSQATDLYYRTSNDSKATWTSWTHKALSTGDNSISVPVTATSENLANGAAVVCIEAYLRGRAGNSKTVRVEHAFSYPNKATDLKAVCDEKSASITFTCEWTNNPAWDRPIESNYIEYLVATPLAGLMPGEDGWNTTEEGKYPADITRAQAQASVVRNLDQGVWVRIRTENGSRKTYSEPVLVITPKPQAPTISDITMNSDTQKATLTIATNSEIPDCETVIIFKNDDGTERILGIAARDATSITVDAPVTSGDYSYGAYTQITAGENHEESTRVWISSGEDIPVKPENVSVAMTDTVGTVRLSWDWTWAGANSATIAWADHKDAWESTSEPSTFTVTALNASAWNISGLDTGKKWYFRVKLNSGDDDKSISSPWSDMVSIDLASTPAVPALTLGSEVIPEGGTVTAAWSYAADGTNPQGYAEICKASYNDDQTISYGDIIKRVTTETTVDISSDELGGKGTYYLCVRVTSQDNTESEEWSAPCSITVAEAPAAVVTTSLADLDVQLSDEETRTVLSTTGLPITVSLTKNGTDPLESSWGTKVLITRREGFSALSADDSDQYRFSGETVYAAAGFDSFSIISDDLLTVLDDDAQYTLSIIVTDEFGLTYREDIDFETHFSHKPVVPSATLELSEGTVHITVSEPEGYEEGDVCDIYRLSLDEPVPVVIGGEFGTTYVDPYPASDGAYRIVDRTSVGDIVTSDGSPAWIEIDSGFISNSILIDFSGQTIELPYDINLDNQWEKGFKRTTYLNGSVQGDWSADITRDVSVSTNVIVSTDGETIEQMRALAVYLGVCHVRTPDGSSFTADVQCSESREVANKLAKFSLEIKAVDGEGYDGYQLGTEGDET